MSANRAETFATDLIFDLSRRKPPVERHDLETGPPSGVNRNNETGPVRGKGAHALGWFDTIAQQLSGGVGLRP